MKRHATTTATRRIACALTVFAALCVTTPATHAQCQYEITSIIQGPPCPPFGSPTVLIGRGMNSHGHVTGSFHDCNTSGHDHGFFWTPETGLVAMHKPFDAYRVNPNDISDAGLIVGTLTIAGTGQRGFVYDMHTQQYLALLEPLNGIGNSSLNAINNAGIAVGARSIGKPGQSPNPSNAVIWNTNTGEVIDLGVGDGPNSGATDITESGEFIGGWTGSDWLAGQAVIWTKGQPQVIGPLPGTNYSIVNAVNESGVAVGSGRIQSPAAFHAFIWDGLFTIFEPIDAWQAARGEAINNLGQALINFSQLQQGHTPFLWQRGELHSLQSLLVSDQQNHSLSWAVGMNDNGQLLCITSSNYAVVLSPADRPLTDLNADCVTDVYDLLMLLDVWGPAPLAARQPTSPADFNGDGVVDVSDLLIMLANWTIERR